MKKGWHFANPLYYRQNHKPVSVLSCHLSSQPTPRKERAALLSLRTLRYIWFCRSRCRHRRMSPYCVVSSYLAVSSLPFAGRFVFCYGIHKITPICAFHSELPFLSGLSSESATQRKLSTPQSPMATAATGSAVQVTVNSKPRKSATSRSTYISLNYLYPSLRSILSFSLSRRSTSLRRAGVISSQCL